jgi:hypothetical protein
MELFENERTLHRLRVNRKEKLRNGVSHQSHDCQQQDTIGGFVVVALNRVDKRVSENHVCACENERN